VLPEIPGETNTPNPLINLDQLGNDLPRPPGAPIINQNKLKFQTKAIHGLGQALMQRLQAGITTIDRNHN
jgi:hypothetical protein